jgi:ketosteroid isomerase-like protein
MTQRLPVRRAAETRAETPAELLELLEDAFNRRDVDAYLAPYEDDAAFVVPPEGRVARGPHEIRSALIELFELEPALSISFERTLEGDDLSLSYARWRLIAAPDGGEPVDLTGRGTMVARRRPDASWGIVLEDPLSASGRIP